MLDAGCNVLCVNLVDRASASEIIEWPGRRMFPLFSSTGNRWQKT